MDNFELTKDQAKERDNAKRDLLSAAVAIEPLLLSEGWKYVHSYIENRVQAFSTAAIKVGFEDQETFNLERGKVNGLLELLGHIDSVMEVLNEERSSKSS